MDNSQVATKSDIKRLEQSTKADIQAVKVDIKAVGTELKVDIKSLRQEILKVEERVENLEDGQEQIKTILKRMENTLDGFVGAVDDLRTDNIVGTDHTRELQLRVNDHEKRLKHVESSKHAA